jgi:hypothetical protein
VIPSENKGRDTEESKTPPHTAEETDTSKPDIAPTPSSAKKVAEHSGQVKDSVTGKGVANVKVSIGNTTTLTDANGYYTLSSLSTDEDAVINFQKEGYLLGSRHIALNPKIAEETYSPNYLEMAMYAYTNAWKNGREWKYESQDGAFGGAVVIPADATVDTDGNRYDGTVHARWVLKDVFSKEGRDSFPGAFKGVNSNGITVAFTSYALTVVELRDNEGNTLDVSEAITLELDGIEGTTADTLPLWYYDVQQGLWMEEGYAQRKTDGTYEAEISHSGIWSLSQPVAEEAGLYRGRIVDANGVPISHARLHAIGENWISSDLSTDENGIFEIEVIPGSSFTLAAYDYKEKFGAAYPGTIAAIASGEIVDE